MFNLWRWCSGYKYKELIEFHYSHEKTVTLHQLTLRGDLGLEIVDNNVISFKEKPKGDGALINAGFFVLSVNALSRIEGDKTIWEQGPLRELAKDRELMTFKHEGFWQPMDTLRDKNYLENLWKEDNAPWKVWS